MRKVRATAHDGMAGRRDDRFFVSFGHQGNHN
jgi:hypothetical protein